jgi:hypothetical protein
VIILQIQVQNIASIESERHPIVASDADCIFTLTMTFERVKTETGQGNVVQFTGAIQDVQANLNSLGHIVWQASRAPGFKISPQSVVFERPDHCYIVTRIVTLVKRSFPQLIRNPVRLPWQKGDC